LTCFDIIFDHQQIIDFGLEADFDHWQWKSSFPLMSYHRRSMVNMAGNDLNGNGKIQDLTKQGGISCQVTRPGKHTKNCGTSPCFYGKIHYKRPFSIAI